MAKTRRGLSSIARGVEERLKNALNFGSKRKREVLDDLHAEQGLTEEELAELDEELQRGSIASSPISSPVPPVGNGEPEIEGNMRDLASNIYRLDKVEEMRVMFNLIISNYNKELSENPENVDELREKLKAKESQLEEFEKEIEIIETEEEIYQIVDSTNKAFEEVDKHFDELIDSLDSNDYSSIKTNIANIIKKLSSGVVTISGYTILSFEERLSTLSAAMDRYKNLTGNEFNSQVYIDFFAEKYVKQIYGELESKIRQAQKELNDPNIENSKIDSLKEMIGDLDKLIGHLPKLLENPSIFDTLKNEIDKALERTFGERQPIQAPSSEPPKFSGSTSLFVVMVEQKMKKIYEKARELSLEFKATSLELQDLLEEFNNDVSAVTYIDEETKTRIISEAEARYNQKLIQELGENVYNFIEEYAFDYQEKQEKLNYAAYGTPEFNLAYKDLMECINAMKTSGAQNNINVTFEEDSQMLTIDFNSDVVKQFNSQIVSYSVIVQMKQQHSDENKRAKEVAKIDFTEKIEKLFTEYYTIAEKMLISLDSTYKIQEMREINKEIEDLIIDTSKYKELTLEERRDIVDKISDEKFDSIEKKYGEGFVEFADRVLLDWYSEIENEELDKVEFGTPEFEKRYDRILNYLEYFKNSVMDNPSAENFIQQISFGEENQTLTIDFKNSLGHYKKQIVSDEILNKMKAAKLQGGRTGAPVPPTPPTPPTPPVPPAPPTPPVPPVPTPQPTPTADLTNPDFVNAKEDYINKLNELNGIIEMINDLNSRIESQAIFNFLDVNNAKNTIQLEAEAKELDQRMMSLKIELSKDRLNIKNKFNVFVITLPEVKSITISDVKFSGSLNEFISQRDEMIVEAENRIIELAEERRINPQAIPSINEEINTLLQFIEAQNSIIGRRLVSDCKTNNINIVDTLRERRENKKEIRARLQEIKNEKVEPIVQPTPSYNVFADKYRALIREELHRDLCDQVQRTRISFVVVKPSENLSKRCKDNIAVIDNNPYYTSVDKDTIKNEEFISINYLYQDIIEKEQIVLFGNLYEDIFRLFDSIKKEDVIEVDFESKLDLQLQKLVNKYPTINELKINLDLQNNRCIMDYNTRRYNFISNTYEFEKESKVNNRVLDTDLAIEYNRSQMQGPKPAPTSQNDIDFNTAYRFAGLYIINQCVISNAIPINVVKYELHNKNIDISNISAVLDKLEKDGVIRTENEFIISTMTEEEFIRLVDKVDLKHDEQDEGLDKSEVKISARKLTFNPKMEEQLASKGTSFIMSGDSVTISLIKNGIKIRYSQELREKLSKLNAKISLVNKGNYRSRTTRTIDETSENQELSFKDGRELSPEDYKIEVRVPNNNQSEVVFEYDLEDISEELRGRSK